MVLIRQILAFAATGLINTGIGLTVIFGLMALFDVPPRLANLGGYAVGLSVSFVLNRWWTFRDQSKGMPIVAFLVAFAISYGANLGVLSVMLAVVPEWVLLAQVAAVGTYSVVFFLLCRIYVFRARDGFAEAPPDIAAGR